MKRVLAIGVGVALAGILCIPALTGAVPLPPEPMKASRRFAWQQPFPQGNPVRLVDFISDQSGWAVGDGGTVLKTNDRGTTWESLGPLMPKGPSTRKTKVWDADFFDATHGWVAADSMLYRTSDGGVTWSDAGMATFDPAGALRCTSVDFTDVDNGWWISGGRMFRTSDGGATAVEQTVPVGAVIDTVEAADSSHAFAYRYSAAGYLATSDGGATWERHYFTGTAHEGQGPWSFVASSESTAYAVAFGDLLKTTDEGSTWTTQTISSMDAGDVAWLVLTPDDDATGEQLYVVTDGNDLHASSDSGATWVKKFDHLGLAGIDIPTATSLFKVTYPGYRVSFSTDSGETWRAAYGKNTADSYIAVDFTSESTGYAATPWALASTANGGASWRTFDLANEGIGLTQINDVTFLESEPNIGWMVGTPALGQPLVYKTTDAGETWTSQEETTMAGVRQMRFSNAQNGWALDGYQSGFWHSADGGNTWALVPHPGTHWDLDWVDADNGWIAFSPMSGGDLALAHTNDGGSTWTTQTIPGSAGIMKIDFADTKTGYAFDSTNKLYKTASGGASWTETEVASFAPDVRLSDIRFTTPLDGWIVGTQFTPAPSPDARHDFAAHTTDGGATWDVVTDPEADKGATGTNVGIAALDTFGSKMWFVGAYGSILKARPRPVVALTSSSKTLTAYNQTTSLTGLLTDDGAPLSGGRVEVWTCGSATGTYVKTSSTAKTAADGSFSVAVRPSSTTYYRVKFAGDAMTRASKLSGYKKIVPKPYVGNPIAPARMTRLTYYTAYGYLKPRHAAGSYPVRIYLERYVSGTWKRIGYVKAKAVNYSSYSKYSARVRLTASGRWRLRAYHPADSSQTAACSSGYDYVTVP